MAEPVVPVTDATLASDETMRTGPDAPPAEANDDGEVEEDTYLVPIGHGCFSFQRGLHRAARTYQIRSESNKYAIISAWLLEGLAVTISQKNWNILSRNKTCATTAPDVLPERLSIRGAQQ